MSLKAIRAPVLVGLVVLGGIAGLIYMVSVIKSTTFAGPDTYSVHAIFEDVTGVVEGSNVTLVGIPVGIIEKISRVETEEGVRARVDIRLSNDVELHTGIIKEGRLVGAATVIRKQSSILGDYYLSIVPGLYGDKLAEGEQIPVVIGTSGVDALFEQMGQWSQLYPRLDGILKNVEDISAGLATALGGEEQGRTLSEIVANLKDVSVEIKEIAERANTISTEVEKIVEEGTIATVAANIEATSSDAREIADKLNRIVSAGNVEELINNLAKTSEELSRFGQELSELVEKGIAPRISQLNRIFQNFERFSRTIANLADSHGEGLSATLKNFNTFSEKIVGLVTTTGTEVEATIGSMRGTLDTAQLSLRKLDETLENVRTITTDMREGKGTIGRLLTDDRLVEEVEEVISDTKEFVKSYTLMQTEVQLASSYFIQEEAAKNVFSIKFKPKVDKYYLLQIVDDPRGYTLDKHVVTETNDPNLPPVVKERIETTSHALKLSFQFAKRFYFMTGRFGIMENTGGLGLDFGFFRDRLSFQFDLFDFTMDENPRLRSQIEWEIMKHFFIAGGGDDLLNDAYRDYYFSAGIRFTDEDLKALLLASPPL